MNTSFEILGLSPVRLSTPALAVALSRAGASGLLDLEFCNDPAQATAQFDQLLRSGSERIGLRFNAAEAALARSLVQASARPLTLILAGDPASLAALAKTLGARRQDRLLAEISDAGALPTIGTHFQGLVLRGHEAGGWVGEYSSFILLQKLAGQTQLPLYVQGGIGVHSAAACRAAGAAGVVLDDQLLLLAESPLPMAQQTELARLNGAETRLFGELVDRSCRVYARPGSAVLKQAEEDNRQVEGGLLEPEQWQTQLRGQIGWAGDGTQLLPLGQGIGLAAGFRDRYRTVAGLVQAIRRSSQQSLRQAAQLRFLDADGPLGASQGTRYPLAQGPMTRVSDSPEFAVEVARAGALPFLALALMRGPQVRDMLEQTRELAGDLPWGVGLLGFIPQALREEQCAEIWQCKPPFALIAGGRPDQAAEFEERGIKTYIHAPAPALLKLYLEQGARRFVFEGRECGGHIGPLASFTLWEEMIEVLLAQVKPGEEGQVHVLFAGGIHDALSGAMVAAMTAPLAARGMKVGALMGTAYLFTREIVGSGAIVDGFQQQALRCERTRNLETGPGHSTRCAATPFADDFFAQRRELIREGRSAEEIRDTLEDLNLGRLRVASKGVDRDAAAGQIVSVAAEQQLSAGMYMIGQVATLRDGTLPIAELHREVCSGAQALLEQAAPAAPKPQAQPSDIAIVGIGLVLPKANDASEYWNNVLHKVSVIREAPESRWDWKLFFDENRKTRDKIYSRWGGFLEEIHFDPTRFGIPPRSMKSIDPMQLLTLEAASRALDDAGYSKGGYDRETTSVILGASGGAGELGLQYGLRAELPRFVENISDEVWERLPEWTEESFAGILPNVAAGRVANRMDFGGVNFTVDAACASSLAAIGMAVNELESGRSSLVLAGGFDTTQSAYGFTTFAKTQALSPSGKSRTFDESADGIAISEGVVITVLKRLADAERDGDRIYAVIKSTAGSSDGKALGLTAPRSEGQVRALDRAYAKAGFSPATLGLIEAHGTGTAVGDRAEAQTITRALAAENAAPRSVAIGSVKTLLGHTKAAAGVAGLAKVALALHHRVLPAHAGVEKPIDVLADPASAAYLLKEPRPWLAHPQHPRRGAASAFGFGGTNFHAVLEEYAGGGTSGAQRWPHELCLFRAADGAALIRELETLRPRLDAGSRIGLAELACTLARQAETRDGSAALAIVATDLRTLAKEIDTALAHLRDAAKPLSPNIRYSAAVPAMAPPVAFLFPGQGAQHLNMGRELALYCDELRTAMEFADRQLQSTLPQSLSSLMLPPAAFDEATETAQARALTHTRVAQPAIGTLSLGYLRLARRLGFKAVAAAGHSYGEYSALLAAGVIDEADFLHLSAVRGRAMGEAAQTSEPGAMAAVAARREAVAAQLSAFAGVTIANHNAPEQCVISGPKAQVEQAAQHLTTAGLRATMLPVSGAFHTQLVAPAQATLSATIRAAKFAPAQFPVYSNQTAQPYPAQPTQMQALLDAHMLSSVEFVAEIEAMHAAGSRVFLELGPKGICSNMARQTLAGKDALAVSLDGNGGGLRGLLLGLAELFTAGAAWQPSALFLQRELAPLSATQLAELAQPRVLPKHLWLLSGGCARPIDDALVRTGQQPALTQASAAAARTAQQAKLQQSLPRLPATAPQLAPVAVAPVLGNEALVAYQQTMRQFLSLQERVIQQFLGGGTVALPQPAVMPVLPSAPASVPVLPVAIPVGAAAAAKPAPVPKIAAKAAPTVDYAALLIGIVAERTGYPSDMLGMDADLEADLGIDSIKRVEILGAFQKALPADTGAQMQASMERYTKAKSLAAILAQLPAIAPAASAAVTTTIIAAKAAPTVDYASLLIGIVAERTGYPSDMLGMNADLEADLGIDSIKRVEILGAFQKTLPADTGAQMQASMERYTKAKSLAAILAQLPAIAPVATAAVTTTIIAAQAAPTVDYAALLIGIVAERTGYPSDMLGMDADLEADLGIDSIKRVEILGAFQKALPADIGAQMQASMERYTKAKSLAAILAQLPAIAPVAAAAVTTTIIAAKAAPTVDYTALLIGIVAERTGYPSDMLGMDADLEADLGIDSIKRVEILGAFQKTLPADIGAQMQASMERYTKAKSLRAILQALGSLQPAAAPATVAASPAAVASPEPARTSAVAASPRYVIKSRPAPLPTATAKLSGLALIVGGPAAISTALQQQLREQGMTPVTLAIDEPAQLRQAIAAARQQHGPARALLQLSGLELSDIADLAAWRARYGRDALGLYHALQALEADLASVRVLAASRFGGSFGRDSIGEGTASGGAANGLFNCLRQEYPQALMRAVDFDGQSDADIAALLAQELAADCREPEVGYVDTVRHGGTTTSQPLTASPFPASVVPGGDWVVLVTGGARGITAEIVEELVRPGMRVVLLGRTPAPATEAAETTGYTDAAQLKSGLLQLRLARGEKPKPVEIEREVSRLMVDREIRHNLARLSDAGAIIEYVACDVRDEASFGALIDGLYERYGNIDAVLHGAGVIEDKLFADKTAESFERVLGTKLDAAFLLSRRLRPDSLKLLAFFTSVAGRYGNRGQGDYAAANETLNRLAWQLHREWPHTRVIAINWGPWDAGMASPAVRAAFKERGIEAIPVAAGRRFFLEEIMYGPRHDVEIVAGAGPWYVDEAQAVEVVASPAAANTALPLLRAVPRMGPGGNMTLDHQFCLVSDPYLVDHRIDGKGVLPATAALEWMAQFVTAAWPGWQVVEMRDFRQMNSVLLDPEVNDGRRGVQLRARASSHSDVNGQHITVEIVDPARKLPFYRASAVLRQQLPEAPLLSIAALSEGHPLAAADAYAHFLFHGPRFQLASEIAAVSPVGLDARVRPSQPQDWLAGAGGHWLFDPGLLDVAPQMAIVWSRLNRDMTALPSSFAAVLRYGNAPLPATLRLALRVQSASHEAAVSYDALFIDDAGRLRLEMRQCESTLSAALNRLGGQSATAKLPQESA